MNDTNPNGMTKSIAPEGYEAWPLLLDEHGRIAVLRNAFECLTAGQLLIQIKAAVPHGEFMGRINLMGLSEKTIRKCMACARLFDQKRDAALLTALESGSKMFELLCLEPEEIEALRLGGQVRGLTLEGLASMTVKELHQALRQSRKDASRGQVLGAEKLEKMFGKAVCQSVPLKVAKSEPLATVEKAVTAISRLASNLTADEEDLLSNYRRCGLKEKFHVAQAAELMAGVG